MKKKMSDLEMVILILKEEFDRATRLDYVRNPLTYALYSTWRRYEENRVKEDR